MPYTDYNQVLQDIADNIREVYGSTDSIRFVDMPDMISGIVAPPVTVTDGYILNPRPWRQWLIPLIGSTSGVTDMSYMFDRTGGYHLDLSHFDTSEVTNMAYMFNLARFDSLDLSSFDTSKVTNMSHMFAELRSSTDIELDLTHFDTSKVTNMRQMFHLFGSSQNNATVTLDVTGWDVSHVTDFSNCFTLNLFEQTGNPQSSITELDLSGWDTSASTNMYAMFANFRLRKLWVPATFIATGCPSEYKPFIVPSSSSGPSYVTCHVYTNATSASAQGWSPINYRYVMHYNSTHEDYENA